MQQVTGSRCPSSVLDTESVDELGTSGLLGTKKRAGAVYAIGVELRRIALIESIAR
jgi:hypothetical protein